MASIDKRPNGKYRARWREYPGGPQKTRQFERKIDAQRFLVEIEHAQNSGSYVDPGRGRQKFEDFAEEWAEGQTWKESSLRQWPPRLARLTAALGEGVPLGAIDQLVLKRARAYLSGRYAYSTAKADMHLLVAIVRAAADSGRIGRDPTTGDLSPKRRANDNTGSVTADQVPTRAEALAILSAGPAGYRAAIALGLAGCRVGEVLGMRVDRLELDTRRVTIDQQATELRGRVVASTPKAEKVRTIVVPQLVAVELRRHMRSLTGDLLFPGSDGGLLSHSSFYRVGWRPALDNAGMVGRFKFHSLRHFCASTLLAEGAPITAVAGHLGDTVQTTAKVYAHWLRDDRDIPADVLDRVLAPAEDSLRTGTDEK
jgi:integrase